MAEMSDENPKIPRIAINDEPAWTPQLTAHGKREASGSGISKTAIFIIVLTTFIVIIIGVVGGNLITTAVNDQSLNTCKFKTLLNDGICDGVANTFACNYDGGDCCMDGSANSPINVYCDNCECLSDGQPGDLNREIEILIDILNEWNQIANQSNATMDISSINTQQESNATSTESIFTAYQSSDESTPTAPDNQSQTSTATANESSTDFEHGTESVTGTTVDTSSEDGPLQTIESDTFVPSTFTISSTPTESLNPHIGSGPNSEHGPPVLDSNPQSHHGDSPSIGPNPGPIALTSPAAWTFISTLASTGIQLNEASTKVSTFVTPEPSSSVGPNIPSIGGWPVSDHPGQDNAGSDKPEPSPISTTSGYDSTTGNAGLQSGTSGQTSPKFSTETGSTNAQTKVSSLQTSSHSIIESTTTDFEHGTESVTETTVETSSENGPLKTSTPEFSTTTGIESDTFVPSTFTINSIPTETLNPHIGSGPNSEHGPPVLDSNPQSHHGDFLSIGHNPGPIAATSPIAWTFIGTLTSTGIQLNETSTFVTTEPSSSVGPNIPSIGGWPVSDHPGQANAASDRPETSPILSTSSYDSNIGNAGLQSGTRGQTSPKVSIDSAPTKVSSLQTSSHSNIEATTSGFETVYEYSSTVIDVNEPSTNVDMGSGSDIPTTGSWPVSDPASSQTSPSIGTTHGFDSTTGTTVIQSETSGLTSPIMSTVNGSSTSSDLGPNISSIEGLPVAYPPSSNGPEPSPIGTTYWYVSTSGIPLSETSGQTSPKPSTGSGPIVGSNIPSIGGWPVSGSPTSHGPDQNNADKPSNGGSGPNIEIGNGPVGHVPSFLSGNGSPSGVGGGPKTARNRSKSLRQVATHWSLPLKMDV